MQVLPLFTSSFSFKGLFTIEPTSKILEGGAPNLLDVCQRHKIEKPIIVEENMVAFIRAKKVFKGVDYSYGLRLTFCQDVNDTSKESEETHCKYIIFANESKLMALFTRASTKHIYEETPRLDFNILKEFWDDSMVLCVPFYDSFIFNNSFLFSRCVPDFSFCSPTFFLEDNHLYFDEHIREKVINYAGDKYEIAEAQSIFYEKRSDFMAWQTYRCIQKRSSLECPELQDCCSDSFCVESYLEKLGK